MNSVKLHPLNDVEAATIVDALHKHAFLMTIAAYESTATGTDPRTRSARAQQLRALAARVQLSHFNHA